MEAMDDSLFVGRSVRLACLALCLVGCLAACAARGTEAGKALADRTEAESAGDALLKGGRWDEALIAYQGASRPGDEDAGLAFRKGCALYLTGQPERALAQFEAAARLDGAARSFEAAGIAAFDARRLDKAAAMFRRAVELDPGRGLSHSYLAGLLYLANEPLRAGAERRQALSSRSRENPILAFAETGRRKPDVAPADILSPAPPTPADADGDFEGELLASLGTSPPASLEDDPVVARAPGAPQGLPAAENVPDRPALSLVALARTDESRPAASGTEASAGESGNSERIRYTIMVGSWLRRPTAEARLEDIRGRLDELGLAGRIDPFRVGKAKVYRVTVGAFGDLPSAQAAQANVEESLDLTDSLILKGRETPRDASPGSARPASVRIRSDADRAVLPRLEP